VLQRGEKLEDVLDKTDKMNANASTFRESSRKLRRAMWWRNVKLNICLCFICLILLVRPKSCHFAFLHFAGHA
jgi:hypothetical protein